jgi:nucleotide-binding universal stress UspA family protein
MPSVAGTDIVVGMDGSPSSREALCWAVEQARLTGARIQVVAVWQFPVSYIWAAGIRTEDPAVSAGKMLSESVREVLGSNWPDVVIIESVVGGHPARMLLDLSSEAGLLVVGSRGHGGFTGMVLGSVSQYCVQHAHCPVVVVRGRR